MKKGVRQYLDPKFVEGFLIFCVIRPGILVFALAVFIDGIIKSVS